VKEHTKIFPIMITPNTELLNNARLKTPPRLFGSVSTLDVSDFTFKRSVKLLQKQYEGCLKDFISLNGLPKKHYKPRFFNKQSMRDPIHKTGTFMMRERIGHKNILESDKQLSLVSCTTVTIKFKSCRSTFIFKKANIRISLYSDNSISAFLSFTFKVKDDSTNFDFENKIIERVFDQTSVWLDSFGKVQPQMFDFFTSDTQKDIESIVSLFKDNLPAISNSSSQIQNLLDKVDFLVNAKGPEFKDQASSAMNDLVSKGSKSFTNATLKIMSIVFFCSTTAHRLVSGSEDYNYNVFFLSIICLVIFARDIFVDLFMKAFSLMRDEESVKPQAGSDLGTGLAFMVISSLFSSKLSKSSVKEIVQSISSFEKFREGLTSIITWFSRLIVAVVDYAGFKDYVPNSLRYLFVNSSEVKQFIDEVQVVIDKINTKSFVYTDENYQTVNFLIETGKKIRLNVRDSASISALSSELNMLTALSSKMRESNFNLDGRRPEPIVLVLIGPPGQLKSQMVSHFIASIAHRAYCKDKEFLSKFDKNTGRYVYPCAQENGFWDGYDYNRKFTLFDDFGQCVDVAGNPDNEYMKLMRAVGEDPYLLHMATLEKKGSTFFSSDFIILTTNKGEFDNIQSLSEPAALIRRMHIPIHVTVKQQYMEDAINPTLRRKLDGTKLPVNDNGTYFDPECVDYSHYDFNLRRQTSQSFSFDEIVTRVVEGYNERIRRFEQKNQQLAITASKADAYCEMEDLDTVLGLPALSIKSDELSDDFSLEESSDLTLREKYDRFMDVIRRNNSLITIDSLTDFYNQCHRSFVSKRDLCLILIDSYAREFSTFIKLNSMTQTFKDLLVALPPSHIERFSQYITYKGTLKSKFSDVWQSRESILNKVFPYYNLICEFKYYYLTVGALVIPAIGYLLYPAKREQYYITCEEPGCTMYSSVIDTDPAVWLDTPVSIISNKKCKVHTCVEDPSIWEISRDRANGRLSLTLREFFGTKNEYQSGYATKLRKAARQKVKLQAGAIHDQNGRSAIDSILRTNVYRLMYTPCIKENINEDTVWESLGMVTFIVDNLALMPQHFVKLMLSAAQSDESSCTLDSCVRLMRHTDEGLQPGAYLTIRDFSESDNLIQTQEMKDRDSICVRLPRKLVRVHKNIIDKFPLKEHVDRLGSTISYRLVGLPGDHISEYTGVSHIEEEPIMVDTGGKTPDYALIRPYSYQASTSQGDCGSLFIVENPRVVPKIFGMHVAGVTYPLRHGFSVPLMRECLLKVRAKANESIPIIESSIVEFQAPPIKDVSIPSGLPQIYDVSLPVKHVTDTKIVHSPLYKKWNMKELSTTDMSLKAFTTALKKYDKYDIPLPIFELEFIGECLLDDLQCCSLTKVDSRLYTLEESIFGIEEDPEYGPISRTTSPGYPLTQERRGLRGKQKWLGSDQDPCLTLEGIALIEETRHLEIKCIEGIRPETIYVDNLKDEKTSLEKAMIGKTRLFSGVPFQHLILVRRYFGAFSLWILKNRIENGVGVGTNPFTEWDHIGRKLTQFSHPDEEGFIAGDFSGFDASGKRVIYNIILDLINSWYNGSPEEERVRTILWLDLTQSKHIHGVHVFEWYNSLPSGHPLTVIVNSLYNLIAFRYCWWRSHDNDLSSLKDFRRYVYLIVYGDDANASVAHPKRNIFNEFTIQKYMKELGLMYTSDTKESFINPFRKLSDVTFLKRQYMKDPESDTYTCPLELMVILTTPGWAREDKILDITKSNVEWCLRELALWPKHVYDYHAVTIINSCDRYLSWYPPQISYRVNRHAIMNRKEYF
jgi:hypothetical protein